MCVYPADHYPYWREALNLPVLPFGAFGENLTVEGLIEAMVCIGDIWTVGGATLQVSQPRQPCWKLARRWQVKTLALQVQQTGWTGCYFRVLGEGTLSAGFAPRTPPAVPPGVDGGTSQQGDAPRQGRPSCGGGTCWSTTPLGKLARNAVSAC